MALREFAEAFAAAGNLPVALKLFHRERELAAQMMAANRDAALAELRQRFDREAQQRRLAQLAGESRLMGTQLDNRAAMQQVWAAGAAEDPRPVLSSLGDLAGEGTPDALAKLVEIAQASALDGALAAAIADLMASVAASAPEDLVLALRAAPASAQDPAVGALGAGLARSEEREHPFPARLKELAGTDGDAGVYARALEPRLDAALKAAAAARAAPALVPAGGAIPASPGGG